MTDLNCYCESSSREHCPVHKNAPPVPANNSRDLNLAGRTAKCSCGKTQPSGARLAFFEYCGPGSREAVDVCRCGYFLCAHTTEGMARNVASNRRTVIELGKCTGFAARGPLEFDRFYCGCRGFE
jgi:hypothetical protein